MLRALFIGIVLLTTGCTDAEFGSSGHPRSMWLRNIPSGDDDYSRGWRDGCQTFTGIVGSAMLRMQPYAFNAPKGTKGVDYYKGWRSGADYCTYYTDLDPI